MTFYPLQVQPYFLAGAGAVIGDTSITLKTMKSIDGTALTMASAFGAKGYLTMEPGNNALEEQVSFTGLVNNANGTTTLTGIKSVTFQEPYTETSGLLKTHAGSSVVVVSNTSGFYNEYPAKQNDETITGQWTFTNTPIVPGTVSDASTTVKGVARISVAPVAPATPISVGDNDPRVPTQAENDALVGTGTPSSSNKYVTANTLTSYVGYTGVFQAEVDQSQATQNASYAAGEANATTKHALIAEKFAAGVTTIRGVRLWKAADTGSFTGTVKIALQADTASSPSGSDLASFTISNGAWLKLNAAAEFGISFSTAYSSLVVGTSYWIVVTTSTTDNSNHPNFGINTAGGYASGALKYQNGTDGWVLTATSILYFKTLEKASSLIVETGTDSLILPTTRPNGYIGQTATSATVSNSTVSTTVNTTVYSVQLEGGQIGPNSGLKITTVNSQTVRFGNNNSDNAGLVIKHNGTIIASFVTRGNSASQDGYSSVYNAFTILNQAASNSQATKYLGIGTVSGTPLDGGLLLSGTATSAADLSQPGLLEIVATCAISSSSGTVAQTVVFQGALIEKIS